MDEDAVLQRRGVGSPSQADPVPPQVELAGQRVVADSVVVRLAGHIGGCKALPEGRDVVGVLLDAGADRQRTDWPRIPEPVVVHSSRF